MTPLLLTDAPRTDADHESTAQALLPPGAQRPPWHHPPGSPYLAWHHVVERSVVYLQPGDGPSAFGNPSYQRLLDNAIAWARRALTTAQATRHESLRFYRFDIDSVEAERLEDL